jgi:hypothetical protein
MKRKHKSPEDWIIEISAWIFSLAFLWYVIKSFLAN